MITDIRAIALLLPQFHPIPENDEWWSREDPFPFVNLETASLNKPIICFDRSGRSKEFVDSDCGEVLPYLDFNAMADTICKLIEHPDLLQNFGDQARKKVLERHSIDIQAPKIAELINQISS